MSLEQVDLNAEMCEESSVGENLAAVNQTSSRQESEIAQDGEGYSSIRVPSLIMMSHGGNHSNTVHIHGFVNSGNVDQLADVMDSSLVRIARGGTTTTSSSSGNSIENMPNPLSEGGQNLIIETTTWSRDSHELFDYEAQHINNKKFLVSKSSKIFRQNTECMIVGDEEELPAQGDYLLSVKTTSEGKFVVFPADRSLEVCTDRQLVPKKVWLIVRDLPGKSYALQQNDMVKLGRFKLRVKQLVKNGDQIPELRLDEMETNIIEPTLDESLTMQCRICLTEGEQENDPLLCPCQCRGSIKFVHLECLRHWINGRLNLANENGSGDTFFFRQLQCELCKSPLPSSASIKGSRVNIVKVPQAKPPFVVLENIYGNVHRGVHVVSMAEKKDLKLGRGHESDVRISDVSISRYHATIRYRNDNFMLEDNDSKFGTLVSVRRPQAVVNFQNLALQVGRTVVNLRLSDEPCSPSIGIKELPVNNSPDFQLDSEQNRGPGGPGSEASRRFSGLNAGLDTGSNTGNTGATGMSGTPPGTSGLSQSLEASSFRSSQSRVVRSLEAPTPTRNVTTVVPRMPVVQSQNMIPSFLDIQESGTGNILERRIREGASAGGGVAVERANNARKTSDQGSKSTFLSCLSSSSSHSQSLESGVSQSLPPPPLARPSNHSSAGDRSELKNRQAKGESGFLWKGRIQQLGEDYLGISQSKDIRREKVVASDIYSGGGGFVAPPSAGSDHFLDCSKGMSFLMQDTFYNEHGHGDVGKKVPTQLPSQSLALRIEKN